MSSSKPKLTFENTEIAYSHKSNWDLRRAYSLFHLFSKKVLVDIGGWATEIAFKWHLPIQPIVKHTVYKQFVGGVSLKEVSRTVDKLAVDNVSVILDWGGEGKTGEREFDKTLKHHLKTLEYVASLPQVKLVSVKVTGMARFGLLEKIHAGDTLSSREEKEFEKVRERLLTLCEQAAASDTAVFIDAEESWIQKPIDDLCLELMAAFNTDKVIVYNTYQLYLTQSSTVLKQHLEIAKSKGYKLGAKLVRGAYMEKERERARKNKYPSPVHKNKEAVDSDFNAALLFCLNNIVDLAFCCATHNEESSMLLAAELDKRQIANNDQCVFFAQLYGMGDHITYNLAKAGYRAQKLIPYGPVAEVVPYLIRRAQENSSVTGQVGRELTMLTTEMKRRNIL